MARTDEDRAKDRAKYQRNKEAIKARSAARYQRNKEAIKARSAAWAAANPDKVKANQKKWLEANAERRREISRKHARSIPLDVKAERARKWRQANPEKAKAIHARAEQKRVRPPLTEEQRAVRRARERVRRSTPEEKQKAAAYMRANREIYAAAYQKRRAREKCPLWDDELTQLVMKEAQAVRLARTTLTGFAWEVDHIVPLAGRVVSGLHVWNNIQVIPKSANRMKSNRFSVTA